MVHVGRKFDSWYLGEESRSTSLIETDAGDVEVTFATSQAVRSVQTESGIEISEQTFEALSRATKRRDSKKKGGLKNLSQRKKEAVEAYCRMQTAAGEWLKTTWSNCDEEMPTHFTGSVQVKYYVVALVYKYLSDKDKGICLKPALRCNRPIWTPDQEELRWILQQAAAFHGEPADIDRRDLIRWINDYTGLKHEREELFRLVGGSV
jgi:hypothetical protein